MRCPTLRSSPRHLPAALLAILLLALFAGLAPASADSSATVIRSLLSQHAYVSPAEIQAGHARTGDMQRLVRAANSAANQGVPEDFAILHTYPKRDTSAALAASDLRHLLNLSGVLVLVAPGGIGVSSDRLSSSEDTGLAQQAAARCLAQSYTDCALYAGQQAIARVKADRSSANRSSTIFWLVVLAVLALVILALVWNVARRRSHLSGRRDDLHAAADHTLSLADSAVQEIEAATSGQTMSPAVRAEYDRALALRDQARGGLDRGTSPEMLTQANQDAAQAVLGLQGVMRSLGIESPLANPLAAPGRRCFYCGHDDRPPYTQETISDDRGNSMAVDVCSVCGQRLAEGRRPQVATVNHGGVNMPWWAVPGNPYYYSYGGPSWQNWLPFFIGMDLGSWFGGGWGYGPGWDADGGNWGDGGWGGGDAGAGVAGVPSDAGGVDFGGWGDGGGADFGGGDSGGADFGGGDWS